MDIANYHYSLPESSIAKYPPMERGGSRLLVLNREDGKIKDDLYKNIDQYFCAGDTLVINDTKVIKARLIAKNSNNEDRELLILEKHQSDNNWFRHNFLHRGRLKVGEKLTINSNELQVESVNDDGTAVICSHTNILELADKYGHVPLPPYLKRTAESIDDERYQTIWAKYRGSVAAPTASLNMTDDIITTLRSKGVNICHLTLHVGLGTFLPIRSNIIDKHKMHKEYFKIPKATIDVIKSTKNNKKRVIALGTTVARALEYSADLITKTETSISGEADIFIYPGYKFKIIDGLLTNYHAPKSTVLMLVAAFASWDRLLPAYEHAIKNGYQFLSYGDSMLVV